MLKPLAIISTCLMLGACQSAPSQPGENLSEEALSGNWTLSHWTGAAEGADYGQANMQFSWQEGKGRVNGNNGCNLYFGGVDIKGNQLQFGQLASTLRACPLPQMKQEQALMKLLADPNLDTLLDGDRLQLSTDSERFSFTRGL